MSKIHTIKGRENLSSLAKRYGLKSWEEIYYSPMNAKIRRQRPNPNQIQVGDRFAIPPNALELAKQKLRTYEKIKKEWEESTKQILSSLEKDHQAFQRTSGSIDFLGSVLTSLVSLSKKAAATVGKYGLELMKANKEFLKTFAVRFGKTWKDIHGLATSGDQIDESKNKKNSLIETGADFLLNFENPSYWAKQVAGDPEKTFANMKSKIIEEQKKQTKLLDQRINQLKKSISFLKGRSPRPL